MNTLQDYLKQATDGYAISLTADRLIQFDTYYHLLTEWNQKINLTAITDPEGVAVKHFADSLSFSTTATFPRAVPLLTSAQARDFRESFSKLSVRTYS